MSPRSDVIGGSMPEGAGRRLDEAHAALVALRDERRRLERLGLEFPLARCHGQVRYWEFVARLLSLPGTEVLRRPGGPAWPGAWG